MNFFLLPNWKFPFLFNFDLNPSLRTSFKYLHLFNYSNDVIACWFFYFFVKCIVLKFPRIFWKKLIYFVTFFLYFATTFNSNTCTKAFKYYVNSSLPLFFWQFGLAKAPGARIRIHLLCCTGDANRYFKRWCKFFVHFLDRPQQALTGLKFVLSLC